MIVLLVYDVGQRPATLVAHGQDNRTWLTLADDPDQRPSAALTKAIMTTLLATTPPFSQISATDT